MVPDVYPFNENMIKPLCLQTLLSTYSLSLTHTHTETECTKATRWQPEPGKVRQWNMYNFIEKLIGIIIIVFVIRKCRWVKEWRMLHFGCVLNLGLFEHIQREKFWNTQKKHTHIENKWDEHSMNCSKDEDRTSAMNQTKQKCEGCDSNGIHKRDDTLPFQWNGIDEAHTHSIFSGAQYFGIRFVSWFLQMNYIFKANVMSFDFPNNQPEREHTNTNDDTKKNGEKK